MTKTLYIRLPVMLRDESKGANEITITLMNERRLNSLRFVRIIK